MSPAERRPLFNQIGSDFIESTLWHPLHVKPVTSHLLRISFETDTETRLLTKHLITVPVF